MNFTNALPIGNRLDRFDILSGLNKQRIALGQLP